MRRLVLLTRMVGVRVAVRADAIDAVVPLPLLVPVPGAPPALAGLATLRSRVLTILDPAPLVGAGRGEGGLIEGGQGEGRALPHPVTPPVGHGRRGLMLHVDGHAYALLVDEVGDARMVADPQPLCRSPGPGWERFADGMVWPGPAAPPGHPIAADADRSAGDGSDPVVPGADRQPSGPYILVDPVRLVAAAAATATTSPAVRFARPLLPEPA